jgi:hypothetical protein
MMVTERPLSLGKGQQPHQLNLFQQINNSAANGQAMR